MSITAIVSKTKPIAAPIYSHFLSSMNTTVSKPVIPVAIRAVNVAKKTNIGQPVASHYKQFWVFAQNANILTLSWAENIEPINNMTMREPVMYKRSSMAWKWATKEAAWRVTETVYEGRIWTNQKKEPSVPTFSLNTLLYQ